MPQTISTTTNVNVEVIAAYTATNQQLDAVADPPAWYVIGGFFMPATAVVRLEAIGLVTLDGVELSCRLFDVAAALPVSGSTTEIIDGATDERVLSGAFTLQGQKLYQIQAQVIGDPAERGVVRAATLVNG